MPTTACDLSTSRPSPKTLLPPTSISAAVAGVSETPGEPSTSLCISPLAAARARSMEATAESAAFIAAASAICTSEAARASCSRNSAIDSDIASPVVTDAGASSSKPVRSPAPVPASTSAVLEWPRERACVSMGGDCDASGLAGSSGASVPAAIPASASNMVASSASSASTDSSRADDISAPAPPRSGESIASSTRAASRTSRCGSTSSDSPALVRAASSLSRAASCSSA